MGKAARRSVDAATISLSPHPLLVRRGLGEDDGSGDAGHARMYGVSALSSESRNFGQMERIEAGTFVPFFTAPAL